MNLVPLGDRLVIAQTPKAERTTLGGIVLPETVGEDHTEGTVLAIGPDTTGPVALGDLVIFTKYGGSEIKIDGTSYVIVPEKQIMAIRKVNES